MVPYGPMKIPITSTCLHYGVSCYEGLNVVKNKETGKAQSFRADKHLMQFLDSSNHLDMPLFDTSELYNCLRHLVEIDKDWFPASTANTPGQLYMRLAHISTDPMMGIASARKTRIFAMMSPIKL